MAVFADAAITGSLNEPGRGILDIELGHIIEDISVKKGGLRILYKLVIFDCCHSGSGTRGSANFRIRGVELPGYKIPENINALSSFSRDHNRRSHILLAACAPDKEAYEIGNHGLFTDALLAIFRKPNLEDLTYLDLITQLQAYRQLINWQIPQCEGLKLDRTVFTLETRPSKAAVYTIQVEDEAATSFRLEGGRRHGIANGAQFAVHTDKRCTSESRVAYVVAQDTQPSVTTCAFLASISEPLHPFHHYDVLYAVQTLHGHSLRLLIDQDDQHCGLQWKKLIEDQVNDISIRSIHLVRPGEEADLAISADGENVLFKVKNAKCREYGARDLSIRDVRVNTDKHLLDILRGAVHFFRHLDLSNFDALRNGPFEVQCLKVEKKSFFSPWMPEPNALNLCHDHKIDIVENKGAPYYGFEIKNRSSYPFHAAVFMFNVHNLQIIRYDLPVNKTPSSNQAVSGSLPAGQSLRVGFGDSGGDARRLTVPDGQNSDISFLKIFLSDTPHDYLGIEQEPSSDLPFSRGDSGPAKSGHELFDTLTVPIIIRARI
ncbi:hypothetical protein H0H93_014816 [Arthromyces matolae]|nr:hypothetical protein H0H93_014816 [Arthromyces matolae]